MRYLSLLSLIPLTSSFTDESANLDYDFTGGEACPNNPEITGYSSLITLNQDMYLNAIDIILKSTTPEPEYLYTLCPNTTFDITSATNEVKLHESIAIFLNNTILQCGTDAKFHHGTCVISGGTAQIVFTPVLETRDAVVKGMTFKGNKGYGVAAYGHPKSDVTFIDCTWIENEALYIASIYYKPWQDDSDNDDDYYENEYDDHDAHDAGNRYLSQEMHYDIYDSILNNIRQIPLPSAHHGESRNLLGYAAMSAKFIKCTFKNNVVSNEVINNQGGNLKLIETTFISNIVKFAVITIAYGGQLSIEQNTHFQENVSPFVPVFVDNDSYLNLNVDNTGELNTGMACTEGIFLENDNSYCLAGGKCDGECCPFGDESCDRYISPEEEEKQEMQAGSPKNDIETASSSTVNDQEYKLDSFKAPEQANVVYKDQRRTVTTLKVIVALLTSALVVMFGMFVFWKGRQHALLGLEPDNPDFEIEMQ